MMPLMLATVLILALAALEYGIYRAGKYLDSVSKDIFRSNG
jgi:hypothetical protein